MALSVPPEQSQETKTKPKFDVENLPNQNAGEAMTYSLKQGAIGGLYGLIGSTTFSLLANRYSPVYRSITLPGKLILVTVATCGTGVFAAERAVYHFNRPFLGEEAPKEMVPFNTQSITSFALKHRFEIVGGLSTAGILGAILYVARDRNKTASEKFMSIRLFSQAAGLMALLGAVGAGALAAQRKHMEEEEAERAARKK